MPVRTRTDDYNMAWGALLQQLNVKHCHKPCGQLAEIEECEIPFNSQRFYQHALHTHAHIERVGWASGDCLSKRPPHAQPFFK